MQVIIEEETEHGHFRDAIYYTPEEFDLLSEQELEESKQNRKSKWVDDLRKMKEDAKKEQEEAVVEEEEAVVEEEIPVDEEIIQE